MHNRRDKLTEDIIKYRKSTPLTAEEERRKIEEFIAKKGVTICPPGRAHV